MIYTIYAIYAIYAPFFYPLCPLWDVRIKNYELRCVGFAE